MTMSLERAAYPLATTFFGMLGMGCVVSSGGFGTSAGDEFSDEDPLTLGSSDELAASESEGTDDEGPGPFVPTDKSSDTASTDTGTDTTDGDGNPGRLEEVLRVAQWDVDLDTFVPIEELERIAAIIEAAQPEVMLVNGIDAAQIELLSDLLGVEAEGDLQGFPLFTHAYAPSCNQAFDLPCMVLFSRHEIVLDETLTFQQFSWCGIPPIIPPQSLAPPLCDATDPANRLYSTTWADVAIRVGDSPHILTHLLITHATEPLVDDAQSRMRNNDQIRVIKDYIDELEGLESLGGFGQALPAILLGYFCDDAGLNACAPLGPRPFVILGNLNADAVAGPIWDDGVEPPAIAALLAMPRVLDTDPPQSEGAGPEHPAATHEHPDGPRRADYVLPSTDFVVVNSGVLWPTPDDPAFELVDGISTHHLTWVDLQPTW